MGIQLEAFTDELPPVDAPGDGQVWLGDFLVCVETGEVVGVREPKPAFAVSDMDSAEWVLEKMLDAETETAALELRLAAIQERMQTLIAEKRRRRQYLEGRFGEELRSFAMDALEGSKKRTLVTPYGSLSFRRAPGGIKVLDSHLAIAWCKLHCPDAVKMVETVVVAPLKEALQAVEGTESEMVPPSDAFQVTPERDVFRIDCGVKGR